MAIPNGFSVPIMKREILSSLGLLTPANFGDYAKRYPDILDKSYIMTAESLPNVLRWSPTKKFNKWENANKPLPAFQVTGTVSGGAGATVTATLTSGSHTASGTLSPVAVGQIYVDDKDNKYYEVVAVSKTTPGAHTVQLSPTDASVSASLTTTSFLKYYGRDSVAEASHQDDGIYQHPIKSTHDMSGIRANKKYSDLTAFEQLDLGINDGVTYYTLDRSTLEDEYLQIQEFRLMFGQKYDNIKYENNQNTDSTGLIPQVIAAGGTYNAPTANTIDQAFFKGLARQNDADGYTNEYQVLVDTEFDMAMDDFLATYAGNGNIVYASFGGSQEVAISRNFSSYSIYGVTYHRKKYDYFNSARTHGAAPNTGYWKNTALFIPQGDQLFEGERLRNFNIHYMSTSEGGKINWLMQDGAILNPTGSTDMFAEVAIQSWKGISAYNLQAYKLAKL